MERSLVLVTHGRAERRAVHKSKMVDRDGKRCERAAMQDLILPEKRRQSLRRRNRDKDQHAKKA